MRLSRAIVGCLALLVYFPPAAAGGAGLPRVAVIGGERARASGWDDLLLSRLAESPKLLQLVDRTNLAAVADERFFQKLLSDNQERGRARGLLQADLLVLLDSREDATLTMVVADTRLGVTLAKAVLRTADRPPEKVIDLLCGDLLPATERFSQGVRYVAAAPDFVSRDLTNDLAFLQSDYAEVLRDAYRQLPGVALVAVEEARAVAAERDVAAGAAAAMDRLVPLFVEAEYRTERQDDGTRSVRITLRARDAGGIRVERVSEPMPLQKAGPYLLDLFAHDLAPLAAGAEAKALDPQAQFDLLSRRADAFAELGEFSRAAMLREASLLVRPDADEQRVRLIREYTRHNRNPLGYAIWPDYKLHPEKDPGWPDVVAQSISDWKRSLQHCEYLVRNRRVPASEASDLCFYAVQSLGVRAYGAPLPECEALKKQFVREVMTRLPLLDASMPDRPAQRTGMLNSHTAIFQTALYRCDGNFYEKDDLDLLTDLITRLLPADMPPSYEVLYFMQHATERQDRIVRFEPADYGAFLDRLVKSDRPVAKIYGRYGRLFLRLHGNDGAEKPSPALLEESRSIVAAANKLGMAERPDVSHFMTLLSDERDRLAYELKPREPALPGPSAPVPAEKAAAGRLTFEAIPLHLSSKLRTETELKPGVRWRAPSGWGGVNAFRPLGDGLDALWASGALLFMTEPGRAVEVLADEGLRVADVVANGPHVWVGAGHGRGVYVLDRTGQQLALIDAKQGLPPTEYAGPLLLPIAPGRVLATGSFGQERRGWIAFIDFDAQTGKAKVNVFHEATKAWTPQAEENWKSTDPLMCFEPEFVFEHRDGDRRLALIGRRYTPLMVDLDAGKVWTYPVTSYKDMFPRGGPPNEAFFSEGGLLYVASESGNVTTLRLNRQSGRFDTVQAIKQKNAPTGRQACFARAGDELYCAGGTWRRVNLKTGEEQLLSDDPRQLPEYGSGQPWRLGFSSNYGLAAFHDGTLYRVLVDGKPVK